MSVPTNDCYLPRPQWIIPVGGTEPPLEHRGIEYTVLPTIPKGWRWSVKRDQRDKGGACFCRDDAIRKAKIFIDNLLRREARESRVSEGTLPQEHTQNLPRGGR